MTTSTTGWTIEYEMTTGMWVVHSFFETAEQAQVQLRLEQLRAMYEDVKYRVVIHRTESEVLDW